MLIELPEFQLVFSRAIPIGCYATKLGGHSLGFCSALSVAMSKEGANSLLALVS